MTSKPLLSLEERLMYEAEKAVVEGDGKVYFDLLNQTSISPSKYDKGLATISLAYYNYKVFYYKTKREIENKK